MVGTKAGKSARSIPSCTECQRRKQKCNRQWPCNHCHSRRISHLCRFAHRQDKKLSISSHDESRANSLSKKDINISFENTADAPEDLQELGTKDELRVHGHLPDDQNLLLGKPSKNNGYSTKQPLDSMTPEVKDVLKLLPPKPYTDILVQRYLEVTNFTYYCLYPPLFSDEYASWWADRAGGRPLAPEFTCLLARVCACSAQYLDPDSQERLESDLGDSVQTLSENLHNSAKRLGNTISPGRGGLAQVQQLFLTAAWYKSESLFVESWHSLASSIHEAQEQGMHKRLQKSNLSEFEIEMRKRMWCLLYTWDWQMSLLLSRPLIISQSGSSIELPNMKLEVQDPENGPPSPILHTIIQCQLGLTITKLDPAPEGVLDPSKAQATRQCVSEWLSSLPQAYHEIDPDTRWDDGHIYVPLQRRQMHAIAYMTMFGPFKPFITRVFGSKSNDDEKASRGLAIDIGLHLMEVCRLLFDQVYPTNAKFQLVTFLIFDTAAFLCSAIIHDQDHSLPRQKEVLAAIEIACDMMRKLSSITKTGAICNPILARLASSLTGASKRPAVPDMADEKKSSEIQFSDSKSGLSVEISPDSLYSSLGSPAAADTFFPASLDFPMSGFETPSFLDLSDFSDIDFGQFDQIWDWQDLDLTLLPELPKQ